MILYKIKGLRKRLNTGSGLSSSLIFNVAKKFQYLVQTCAMRAHQFETKLLKSRKANPFCFVLIWSTLQLILPLVAPLFTCLFIPDFPLAINYFKANRELIQFTKQLFYENFLSQWKFCCFTCDTFCKERLHHHSPSN